MFPFDDVIMDNRHLVTPHIMHVYQHIMQFSLTTTRNVYLLIYNVQCLGQWSTIRKNSRYGHLNYSQENLLVKGVLIRSHVNILIKFHSLHWLFLVRFHQIAYFLSTHCHMAVTGIYFRIDFVKRMDSPHQMPKIRRFDFLCWPDQIIEQKSACRCLDTWWYSCDISVTKNI